MSALTLPGTIPGLLRRGSPAFRLALGDASRQEAILVHAIAERPQLYGGDGSELCAEIRSGPLVWWPTRCLALDLTDPTGRAHAAWFATGRTDVDTPSVTSPTYPDHTGTMCRDPGACLRGDWSVWTHVVAHLNPDDDTRLPDGSRWVDAEALRLVCLHVAGVSS